MCYIVCDKTTKRQNCRLSYCPEEEKKKRPDDIHTYRRLFRNRMTLQSCRVSMASCVEKWIFCVCWRMSKFIYCQMNLIYWRFILAIGEFPVESEQVHLLWNESSLLKSKSSSLSSNESYLLKSRLVSLTWKESSPLKSYKASRQLEASHLRHTEPGQLPSSGFLQRRP